MLVYRLLQALFFRLLGKVAGAAMEKKREGVLLLGLFCSYRQRGGRTLDKRGGVPRRPKEKKDLSPTFQICLLGQQVGSGSEGQPALNRRSTSVRAERQPLFPACDYVGACAFHCSRPAGSLASGRHRAGTAGAQRGHREVTLGANLREVSRLRKHNAAKFGLRPLWLVAGKTLSA